jgi:hypothetical protein
VSALDRKSRIRDYKENPPAAGVFGVRNTATGRLLIGHTANLPGMLNRQRFQLEMGSHPDRELQADWSAQGPDSFEFDVLDELETSGDLTPQDLADELAVLHRLWLERLAGRDLYPQSRRGV